MRGCGLPKVSSAVRELSSQHLVSGIARVAGATATLLKLTFGTVAATQLCHVLGVLPAGGAPAPVPVWVEWLGLLGAALSFAVLFRSAPRDGRVGVHDGHGVAEARELDGDLQPGPTGPYDRNFHRSCSTP